jgi:hypothetical protein
LERLLNQTDDTAMGAARAAMFALGAAPSSAEGTKTLIMLPRVVPMKPADLIGLLAAETKHLTCVGVPHRTAFAVAWWPTEPADAETHRSMKEEMLAGVERQLGRSTTDARVTFMRESDRLDVSYRAMQRLMFNFYLPFVDYHFTFSETATSPGVRQIVIRVVDSAFHFMDMRRII